MNLSGIKWWARACRNIGIEDIRGICLKFSGGKDSQQCSQQELDAVERGLKSAWLHTRFQQIQHEHRKELY